MFFEFKLSMLGGLATRRSSGLMATLQVAFFVVFAGMCLPAVAQTAPTITNISPNTVSAGGPSFTLNVSGSGYVANSVVQINGSSRSTVYGSASQVTATVLASDIAVPAVLNVTVLNTSSGAVQTSNAVALTVVKAASPVLTSASPAFLTQGVTQLNMTLVGANFRPGATVVISPPLATVGASNGHAQAGDVTVLSATVVNSSLMTALVSLSPTAVLGLRAADVLNVDGTSTVVKSAVGSQGTSQPLHVSPTNSIGSPLSVLNMAMMHPRDGTVVMQGDELDAEAVLAGTGTGTVIGEWVWDGNVVEQFSATIVGGQSAAIETRQSLPTWHLGSHMLQLRMLQPNQAVSRPIEVVVNPGKWKLEQLIKPVYGAVFSADTPPHLLWAVVPGAMKYQVGLSSKPYFSTIDKWMDVSENQLQLPANIWQSLPEGDLYWTVRTIDASGKPRKPLPMRLIKRASKTKLNSPGPAAQRQVPGSSMRTYARLNSQAVRLQLISARTGYLRQNPVIQTATAPTAAASSDAEPAKAGTDAEAPPAASNATPARPAEDGQIALNTQWASGSNPPDSNALSVADHLLYQQSPWSIEVNGSGLLNSILNPLVQRTSQGKVNDYVSQLGYQRKNWRANLQFGVVSPAQFTDAQFVSEPTARQGLVLALKTPGGTFSGYTNTDDIAAGGGSGMNVKQQIVGASWQTPLPQWAHLQWMWLNVADAKVIGAPSASGDVYGGLLNINLTPKWMWTSEYAVSHDNPDSASATSTREFGRAWRTGISGQSGKTNVNIAYRDVSANFGNPANPGLSPGSQPNVRGLDSSITQTTKAGTFGLTYTFLANNVRSVTSDELLLNTFEETWSKPIDVKTNISLDARQSLTQTGTVPAALAGVAPALSGAQDIRDLSGSINLSRIVGTTTLSMGAQRDWDRNILFPESSTITTSLNAGANFVTQGVFQLNTQASVNWVAADGLTVGTSRNVSVNLQPAMVWKKPALQLSPTIAITQGQTMLSSGTLSSNTFTGQYGGRLTWTLPGRLKFSTLSAQGSYNQNRNTITGVDNPNTELLAVWTTSWNHKHNF